MWFRNWRTGLKRQAAKGSRTRTSSQRNIYQPRVEGLEERNLLDGNCVVPPDGLISWWTGDDTFNDLRGLNNGVMQGSVTFTPGMVGQGFNFTGAGWVNVADDPSLDLTGELTLEFWFKYSSVGAFSGLVAKRTDDGGKESNYGVNVGPNAPFNFGLYYNDPTVSGQGDDGGDFEAIRAPLPYPTPDVFHHFAGTYKQVDSTHIELTIYIDGVNVRQATLLGNLANTLNNVPLTIGASNGTGHEKFTGVIDEVSLYGRALSAAEIQAIFNAGSNGKCKHPIAVNDTATTNEDTPVGIDVLANDISPTGEELAVFSFSNAQHGGLVLNPDGTFTYSPDADFNGSDSFTYKLTSDGDSATVSITILAVNDAPVANAGPNQDANEGAVVTFDGSGSFDVDGDPLTYSWDFADGGSGSGVNPTHVYADNGTYTATLTVSDGVLTAADNMVVTAANVAPTVDAGNDVRIRPGTLFTRTGSFTDPGADTWSGLVNYGEGEGDEVLALNPDKSFNLEHRYTRPGDYTVTVTVMDDDGGVGVDSFIVHVVPPGQSDGTDGFKRHKGSRGKDITRFFSLFGDSTGNGCGGKSAGLWFFDFDGNDVIDKSDRKEFKRRRD